MAASAAARPIVICVGLVGSAISAATCDVDLLGACGAEKGFELFNIKRNGDELPICDKMRAIYLGCSHLLIPCCAELGTFRVDGDCDLCEGVGGSGGPGPAKGMPLAEDMPPWAVNASQGVIGRPSVEDGECDPQSWEACVIPKYEVRMLRLGIEVGVDNVTEPTCVERREFYRECSNFLEPCCKLYGTFNPDRDCELCAAVEPNEQCDDDRLDACMYEKYLGWEAAHANNDSIYMDMGCEETKAIYRGCSEYVRPCCKKHSVLLELGCDMCDVQPPANKHDDIDQMPRESTDAASQHHGSIAIVALAAAWVSPLPRTIEM